MYRIYFVLSVIDTTSKCAIYLFVNTSMIISNIKLELSFGILFECC